MWIMLRIKEKELFQISKKIEDFNKNLIIKYSIYLLFCIGLIDLTVLLPIYSYYKNSEIDHHWDDLNSITIGSIVYDNNLMIAPLIILFVNSITFFLFI